MMPQAHSTQFFYQKDKLITVEYGGPHRTVFRTTDLLLAERSVAASDARHLLVTDDKASVLSVQGTNEGEFHTYSAYGYDPRLPSPRTLLGFNGEAPALIRGIYALGNGHRSFNTAMMRFTSPDTLSPFGKGGINTYCYCACDPINNVDPSGRMKRTQRPPAQTTRSAPSANFISRINEPDVFSRIVKHLDLDSATALSMTSKHLNNMTRPAFQKMKRSLNDPAKLFDSAFAGTVGPALGHSRELLVKRSDLPLPAQSSGNNARDQFIRDILADRQFRQAQRGRSPSIDSSSASDSDDEMQRVNRGIRKALDGPQL